MKSLNDDVATNEHESFNVAELTALHSRGHVPVIRALKFILDSYTCGYQSLIDENQHFRVMTQVQRDDAGKDMHKSYELLSDSDVWVTTITKT